MPAAHSPALERLGHTAQLPGVSFDEAKACVVAALKAEGFGVLTEIDVASTLKAKLGVDFRRYVILGACNPNLAHQALSTDLGMGLLLPCNACVWEDGDSTTVSIVRPEAMFSMVDNETMRPLMQDAEQRLQRALQAITAGAVEQRHD